METLKKEIDVNENDIRHLVTILYGLIAGVIAIFIGRDLYPTTEYLFLELLGVIFVVLTIIGLLGKYQKRYNLIKEIEKIES